MRRSRIRKTPFRDEARASPASLEILMNVSMHILTMWARVPYKTRYTDFFLFFQLFDFPFLVNDIGPMKKRYAGRRTTLRLLTGS